MACNRLYFGVGVFITHYFLGSVTVVRSVDTTGIYFDSMFQFTGQVLMEMDARSQMTCQAICGTHQPACLGSRYHDATRRCQLLTNNATMATLTFHADAGWEMFVKPADQVKKYRKGKHQIIHRLINLQCIVMRIKLKTKHYALCLTRLV